MTLRLPWGSTSGFVWLTKLLYHCMVKIKLVEPTMSADFSLYILNMRLDFSFQLILSELQKIAECNYSKTKYQSFFKILIESFQLPPNE